MVHPVADTDVTKERDALRAAIIDFLTNKDENVLVDALGKKRFDYELPKRCD